MFRCKDCGHLFPWQDFRPDGLWDAWEYKIECPCCGGRDVEEEPWHGWVTVKLPSPDAK